MVNTIGYGWISWDVPSGNLAWPSNMAIENLRVFPLEMVISINSYVNVYQQICTGDITCSVLFVFSKYRSVLWLFLSFNSIAVWVIGFLRAWISIIPEMCSHLSHDLRVTQNVLIHDLGCGGSCLAPGRHGNSHVDGIEMVGNSPLSCSSLESTCK